MPKETSVINEGLQALRIGVVALFGIVVPGVWFCATTTLYVAFGLGSSLDDVQTATKTAEANFGPYLSWIVGSVLVYVTGSILRILPPDLPDSLSLLGVKVRSKEARIDWPGWFPRFPYESLPTYLRNRGLFGLASLVPWDKRQEGGEPVRPRSKTFLHFIKLHITLQNPQLANHLARQEAFIRLLSGVSYAVFVSTLVFLGGLAMHFRFQRTWNELASVATGVLIFNSFVALGILLAFHYQRRRELVMILSAYFLIGPPDRSPYAGGSERARPPGGR